MVNQFVRCLFDLRIAMAVVISFSSLFQVGFMNSAAAETKQEKEKRKGKTASQKKRTEAKRAQVTDQNGKTTKGTFISGTGYMGESTSVFVPDLDPRTRTYESLEQLANRFRGEKVQATAKYWDDFKHGRLSRSEMTQVDPDDPTNPARYENELEKKFGRKFAKDLDKDGVKQFVVPRWEAQKAPGEKLNRQIILDKSVSNVMGEQSLRFPIDTAMFFVVIGSIIAVELMVKGGGDPLAMQRHFESLTDPIAHLSFYSFMATNGIVLDRLQKTAHKRLSEANHRLLFTNLPLISMPFGSLVSHLVGDGALAIKLCTAELMRPTLREKNLKKEGTIYTACEETLRTWRFANRANLIIPQILSLTLANIPVFAGIHALNKYTDKTGVMMLSEVKMYVGKFGHIVAPKLVRFLGSPLVGLGLSMMIFDPIVFRAWNSYTDSKRMNWAKEAIEIHVKHCKEDIGKLDRLSQSDPDSPDCDVLKTELLTLRDRSISWRSTILSEFETGFASWSELMRTITNQKFAAQGMYEYVFSRLLEYYGFWYTCQNEKDLQVRAVSCDFFSSFYQQPNRFQLTRPYPLLGFDVDRRTFKSKGNMVELEEHNMRLRAAQTVQPSETEKNQLLFLANESTKFLQNAGRSRGIYFDPKIWDDYQKLISQLASKNKSQVYAAWIEFDYKLSRLGQEYRENKELFDLLISFKKSLGKPNPKVDHGDGFLWAISDSEGMFTRRLLTDSHIASYKYNYVFPTTAHYFLHEMICGPKSGEIANGFDFKKVGELFPGSKIEELFGYLGKMWQAFTPPRLLNNAKYNHQLCNPQLLPDQKKYELRFKTLNGSADADPREINPMMYLVSNFDSSIFLRKDDNGVMKLASTEESFSAWWSQSVDSNFESFIHDSQVQWGQIYAELIAAFNDQGYVQNSENRQGVIKNAKGLMSDLSSQSKNPLQVILDESKIYYDVLEMLNSFRIEKVSKEQRASLLLYKQAQAEVVTFLKSAFDNVNHADEATAINAAAGPDLTEAMVLLTKLAEAFGSIRDNFYEAENSPLLKSIAKDAVYALEGTHNDLNKYLMSAFLVNQANNEQAQKIIQSISLISKGQLKASGSKGYNIKDKGN